MILSTLKLAGIATLAVVVAYAIGRGQGYNNGYQAGYDKKEREVVAATEAVNKKNSDLPEIAARAIQENERLHARLSLLKSAKMQCLVTREFAQRFEQ